MPYARRSERRRTIRVPLQVPLLAGSESAEGETLFVKACSQRVSADGALILLDVPVTPGQPLILVNEMTSETVQCYVTSVRQKRDRRFVGVSFAIPVSNFWHMSFPPAGTRPATRALRTGILESR
jgi:hypothetical protein